MHIILPLDHSCIIKCAKIITCSNLSITRFLVIFEIKIDQYFLAASIGVNNKPFVIVNGPAVRSSTGKKGKSAESEEEEQKILDYLSDETDSETVLVSNEKLSR